MRVDTENGYTSKGFDKFSNVSQTFSFAKMYGIHAS